MQESLFIKPGSLLIRRHLLATALLPLTLCCVGATGANAATDAPITSSPTCSSSFDPYDYTPSALAACGITAIPLSGTDRLPDGGTSYNYGSGSDSSSTTVPPTGFNALQATTAELSMYSLPPAPTSSLSALAAWTRAMTNLQFVTPPPFLAELPITAGGGANVGGRADHLNPDSANTATAYSTQNWSGYVEQGNAWTATNDSWTEPTFSPTSCSTSSEVTWNGIGGFNDNDLGQEGTAFGVSGLSSHQMWREIYPKENIIAMSGSARAGDQVLANTGWNPSTSKYSGSVQDTQTGKTQNWSQNGAGYYSGAAIESIAERPGSSSGYSNLSNFGTMYFITSYGGQGNAPFTDASASNVKMTSDGSFNGHLMAQPGPVNTQGPGDFHDTQYSCS